jgi:CRP-like cAMP-binding protein
MDRSGTPNRLLAILPNRVRQRLISRGHEFELTAGEILYSPGTRLSHAHFPLSGVITTRIPYGRRSSLQVELTGTEGMIGLPLVFGVSTAMLRRNVQSSGTSLCITAASLRQELTSSRALRETLGRYACVLRAQLAETVGCNSFHLLKARLARWLLETLDRTHSNQFHLTHEALGEILGVRRESITSAASTLQRRKLMNYSRGDITIINRAGLEKTACQCYSSARDTYEQYLGF